MTSKVDTFGLLISNFSSKTQQAVTDNFTHSLSLTKSRIIKSGLNLIPEIDYSGAKLTKQLNAMKISTGSSYTAYTNYENILIKSTPIGLSSTSDVLSFTYEILNITQDPYSSVAVSHDNFEKIDPNYNKDELEFSVALSANYSVSIVFAKAPPARKVRYPELFNESIHTADSFWDYSASNLTDICESDLLKENERVVYLRIRRGGNPYTLTSGTFKDFALTSLGIDGRFVLKSDVLEYLASAKVTMEADSEGYLHNELMYPIKDDNSVVDISKINEHNKLKVKFNIELNSDAGSSQIIASITSDDNVISLTSQSIPMPYYSISDIYSSVKVSSKVENNDLTISSLEIYSDVVGNTTDPLDGSRYAPPVIYLTKGVSLGTPIVLDSSGVDLYLPLDLTLIFNAIPSHRNVPSSQIWISLDGGDFINATSISISGTAKYKTHTFKAYVEGSGDIESSIVVERQFTIYPVMSTPVFSVNNSNGILTVSATSEFAVLYSTDGAYPDYATRSNVALYTKPFKIDKRTIIKAVSVFEHQYSSVVEYVFDPDEIFTSTATLATITITI